MGDAGAAAHMAQSDRLYFRADDELREAVEDYQQREALDSRSDATRELVEVGLREQQNPLLWRSKDRVVEWINLLSISAVVVFALGAATELFALAQGVLAALVLLSLACVLLAAYEFVRVVAGINEVGVRVRDSMAALATVVGWR